MTASERYFWTAVVVAIVIALVVVIVVVDISPFFGWDPVGDGKASLFARFPIAIPAAFSIALVSFSVWKFIVIRRADVWGERVAAALWFGAALAGAVYFATQALKGGGAA